MITDKNYFTEIDRIGISSLPDTLRKSHDFVVKSTGNGSNWDTYHNNETIRKVTNLYFEKLNQYLGTQSAIKNQQGKPNAPTSTPKSKSLEYKGKPVAPRAKPKQQRKEASVARRPGKKVEHIREEVKFIKRFVALHNKVKSPNSILSLLKALQKAIVQKLIRKTSPLAKEIQTIQDKLVNLCNSMKGDLKIEIKSGRYSIRSRRRKPELHLAWPKRN